MTNCVTHIYYELLTGCIIIEVPTLFQPQMDIFLFWPQAYWFLVVVVVVYWPASESIFSNSTIIFNSYNSSNFILFHFFTLILLTSDVPLSQLLRSYQR